RLIEKHGVPEDVDRAELRAGLLEQVVRIAKPELRRITRDKMHIAGFDAASIKAKGFDKIWQKAGLHGSLLFYGSDNIDAGMIRQLLNVLENPLTLDEIHAGIKAHFDNTGKRLTFYSGYIAELKITAHAL